MTKEWWLEWFKNNEEFFLENYRHGWNIMDKVKNDTQRQKGISSGSGATKECIIDETCNLVFKWSTNLDYDETKRECAIYEEAISAGIECFFPKTEQFIDYGKMCVYVQERVSTIYSDLRRDTLRTFEKTHHTVTNRIIDKAYKGFESPPQIFGLEWQFPILVSEKFNSFVNSHENIKLMIYMVQMLVSKVFLIHLLY